MKEVIKTALNRPIATVIIISCISRSVANIISAAKGQPIQPVISVIKTDSKAE